MTDMGNFNFFPPSSAGNQSLTTVIESDRTSNKKKRERDKKRFASFEAVQFHVPLQHSTPNETGSNRNAWTRFNTPLHENVSTCIEKHEEENSTSVVIRRNSFDTRNGSSFNAERD